MEIEEDLKNIFEESSIYLQEISDSFLFQKFSFLLFHLNFSTFSKRNFQEISFLFSYLWERIHENNWKQISSSYHYYYTIITILYCYYSLNFNLYSNNSHESNESNESHNNNNNNSFSKENLLIYIKYLDYSLLLGLNKYINIIQKIISYIEKNFNLYNNLNYSIYQRKKYFNYNLTIPSFSFENKISLRQNILIEDCPNLLLFHQKYFDLKIPVILKNCMTDWSALTLWSDLEYINSGFFFLNVLSLFSLLISSNFE